ncbi:MAG: right-handed parallel beta-helix repeat-containing protein, partial [Planctomycetota bacterium]
MVTRKNLNTALATSIFLLMVASGLAKAARIYVDASASGNGSGTSWADAFNYLQDALAAASSGDEVWVAEGIYRPDQGTTVLPGSREATFQLINGVALYGGFPAGGGPWQDRDPTAHETILSGDIGTPNGGNAGDNSYHVVTGSGTDATAVLDGFVITAGYADGIARDSYGGGMYNDEGSPTIANCTFRENSAARRGGAIYNKRNNPALSNCILTGNTAGNYGGAIYNQSSNPTITDCTFSGNIALLNGGGMYNGSESCPLLTACTFTGNLAEADGGGMYNYDGSTTTLTDCTFRRNSANGNGGGVWNDATLTLTNCTISGNSAQNKGGGMYCYYGNSTIDGGTISNNKPDAVWIEAGRVRVTGTVQVVSNDLAGGGTLNLEPDATLKLDDSLVLCNLSGTGSIEVDIASELVIQGDAVVDLGDPNDPNKRGHIQCGGLLQMKGNAKIHNANVKFTRGFFGDNSQVSNSIITVDSNAPYGQFFIDPNVSLVGNVFIVDGDRYGDMRPS